jgi:hypothetical protein
LDESLKLADSLHDMCQLAPETAASQNPAKARISQARDVFMTTGKFSDAPTAQEKQ